MRRLLLLILPALMLAAPASAPAALKVGLSENNPEMFGNPLFTSLGVKQTRVVVSYNVIEAAARGDDELTRVSRYISAAALSGVDPLVTFEHARGAAEICNKRANYRKSQCRLPSVAEYQRNITAFLQRFPTVKTISPWNEWNHFTQATSRNPKRAAQFSNTASKVCKALLRRCTIIAMDVLDQADSAAAKVPTYKSTTRMIKKFRRSLKIPRRVCGLHNYSDTNRFRDVGTKTLIKAMGCKQVWLTETGGLYDFGSFWSKKTKKGCRTAASCQVKATKYMFKLARKNRAIKRLYVYTFFGGHTPRFDAGLVNAITGKPRPAYNVVKARI